MTTPPPAPVTYSFCEPVHQVGTRWHIRERATSEPLFVHGAIPAGRQALCGSAIANGWDIPGAEVTTDAVARLLQPNARAATGNAVCARCADTFLHPIA